MQGNGHEIPTDFTQGTDLKEPPRDRRTMQQMVRQNSI